MGLDQMAIYLWFDALILYLQNLKKSCPGWQWLEEAPQPKDDDDDDDNMLFFTVLQL
jgi:methionyl-tRNA synthetase